MHIRPLAFVALLFASRSASAHQITRITHDVTLDPGSAHVDASTDIDMSLDGNDTPLYGLVDNGLGFTSVTADVPITSSVAPYAGWNVDTVQLTASGASTARVTFRYAGRLQCPKVGEAYCDVTSGVPMRLRQSSAILLPYLKDSSTRAPQTLRLRAPSGTTLVVSGEPTSLKDDGRLIDGTWTQPSNTVPNFDVLLGMEAVDLGTVLGKRIRHYHAPGDDAWAPRLRGMFEHVVPFVEALGGRALPYSELSLVKLSPRHREYGYTTHGMVLLSDWHGSHPDPVFEEEWAHELSHLFFGMMVSPSDYARQRVMTEGTVVLAEYDYARERFHADEDRDEYLARRTREAELLMRYVIDRNAQPSLVSKSDVALAYIPDWAWAYAQSAAFLDHLRVLIGDAPYAEGLKMLVNRCAFQACDIGHLERVMQEAAGKDLQAVYRQWLHGSIFPEVSVGFRSLGETRVSVTLAQNGSHLVDVELWLEGAGARTRRVVSFQDATATFELGAEHEIERVRINPRQDALLWTRSAQAGDVDFDGRSDGFDLVHCARLFDKRVEATFQPGGESLTGIDLRFDPRCDANANGVIDAADLEHLAANFGSGR